MNEGTYCTGIFIHYQLLGLLELDFCFLIMTCIPRPCPPPPPNLIITSIINIHVMPVLTVALVKVG